MGNSRTFGKGTVQTVIEVPGSGGRITDGAIHVTVAKFFRPSGRSNQEKGIISDILIPDIIEATEIGEKENDYALPYTTIKASREYKPEQDLSSLITKLQKISKERIDKSTDFKKITDAIDKAKKDKNTLVSLKENKEIKNNSLAKNNNKQAKDKLTNNKEGLGNNKKNSVNNNGSDSGLDEEDNFEFSSKVIRKSDIQLKEAVNILLDSIQLSSNNIKN